MQIHSLKVSRKEKKRIGRGGKRGTYSGRGGKGQTARSGGNVDPLFEGGRSSLIERLKKVRGFKSHRPKLAPISLSVLDKNFKDNDTVTIQSLLIKKIINRIQSQGGVKVLASGKISKKLIFTDEIKFSLSAKNIVEKIGGKIEAKKDNK